MRFEYLVIVGCLILVALFTSCTERTNNIVVEEFPICTNEGYQESPAVSGNVVVWRDSRNKGSSIYGLNLDTNTEFLVCFSATITSLDVSGNIVIWSQHVEETGWDIWGYNLETEERFVIYSGEGDQVDSKISGNYVVWRNRGGPYSGQIQVYNLLTSTVELSTPTGISTELFDVDGNILIVNAGKGLPIRAYDLEKGYEFSIPTQSDSIGWMGIGNNTVVWIDYSPTFPLWQIGRAGDIMAYDMINQTHIRLPETWSIIYSPVTSGDFIVWQDGGYVYTDILGYDLATQESFVISDSDGSQMSIDIDGNVVVWMDTRSGSRDIYGARILRGSE